MQLNFLFKNGHSRIINVTPEFFETVWLPDFRHAKGAKKAYTAANKARDMAHDLDPNPYKITLMNGTGVVIEDVIPSNKPSVDKEEPIEYTKEDVKLLRRQFKGQQFGYKIVPGAAGFALLKRLVDRAAVA